MHAQISKGSHFIGGSLGFSNSKQETQAGTANSTSSSDNWNLNLQYGKAIKDNRIAGLYLYTGGNNTKSNGGFTSNQSESSTVGGGAFFRQYYGISSRWYVFGEILAGYSHTEEEAKVDNIIVANGKGWTASTSLSPGISFAASRKLHFEIELSNFLSFYYSDFNRKSYFSNGSLNQSTDQKQFGGQANLNPVSSISIGLRWILSARQKNSSPS
jgi:hypothetical protein